MSSVSTNEATPLSVDNANQLYSVNDTEGQSGATGGRSNYIPVKCSDVSLLSMEDGSAHHTTTTATPPLIAVAPNISGSYNNIDDTSDNYGEGRGGAGGFGSKLKSKWESIGKGIKVALLMIIIVPLFVVFVVVVMTRGGNDDDHETARPPTTGLQCWEGGCGFEDRVIVPEKGRPCSSWIYCQGPLLHAIETAQVFPDSKTFVDMPMKATDRVIFEAFKSMSEKEKNDKTALTEFVDQWFHPAGFELALHTPVDYTDTPQFLDTIKSPSLRSFGSSVNSKWKLLVRRWNFTSLCDGCHSSLDVPNPFVVPGGRFREFYYWDSFWILQGLMVSEMTTTASDMLSNMLLLLQSHGFMPNGARVYYLDRSQPPVLTLMLSYYLNVTAKAGELVATPTEKFTAWWSSTPFGGGGGAEDYGIHYQIQMDQKDTTLKVLRNEVRNWNAADYLDGNGNGNCPDIPAATKQKNYINISALRRYCVHVKDPRPESYFEDYTTLQEANNVSKYNLNRTAEDLYSNIAAGAETGMDYSTRWFTNYSSIASNNNQGGAASQDASNTMASIQTMNIIPADLNAIIIRDEQLLSELYLQAAQGLNISRTSPSSPTTPPPQWMTIYNNTWRDLSIDLETWSTIRENAMVEAMWDQDNCSFFDFNLATGKRHSAFYVSNMVPLWVPSIATKIFEKQQNNLKFNNTAASAATTICTFDSAKVTTTGTAAGGLTYKAFNVQVDVGGIPTSLQHSGQQWDFPNAWAPSQWFVMEALRNWANLEAAAAGEVEGAAAVVPLGVDATTAAGKIHWTLIQNWVNNNYCGWSRLTGAKGEEAHNMFEKYNALDVGDAGHGGEYSVQVGFGWTNGLILTLLQEFGDQLTVPASEC